MKTKAILSVMAGAAVLMLLGGCKEKKQANDETIIAIDYTPPVVTGPISMDSLTESRSVVWMNRGYTVSITRVPMPTLPMVSNDYGQKYVDNRVTVVVRRPDGSEFYNEVFTKSSFSTLLDADYKKNGLLAGIRFVKAEGQRLEFAVSIAHALLIDSEEMVLKLTVDSQKNLKIDYDDQYDIVPGDDDDVEA